MAILVRVRLWCETCQSQTDVDAPLEGKPHKLRVNLEEGNVIPVGWKFRSRTYADSRKNKIKPELEVFCPACVREGNDVG